LNIGQNVAWKCGGLNTGIRIIDGFVFEAKKKFTDVNRTAGRAGGFIGKFLASTGATPGNLVILDDSIELIFLVKRKGDLRE